MRVYVAGSRGMVGSALARRLEREDVEVLTDPDPRVDLRDQRAATKRVLELSPDWVFLAAARVGGIHANNIYPADFIYDNIMIQSNVLHASVAANVKKLLFLGSSCIYPKLAPQPIKEEHLLTGLLEPTNEPYAVAKIAGVKMAQAFNRQYGTNFISAMPTNLYGPNDNFDLQSSHVLPALIRKIHEAKASDKPFVEIWGSGRPRREFLHVDDAADALVFLMREYESDEIINVGAGKDISIKELAELIAGAVGYTGSFHFDTSMPDGTPRKLLDVTRLTELGWRPKYGLEDGIAQTYRWFVDNASDTHSG